MFYIYTFNNRVLKIVPDAFRYEPANFPGLIWYRYHLEPPFIGKAENYRTTFGYRSGYSVSTFPLTSKEELELNLAARKLEVMEKFNRMQATYKGLLCRGEEIFNDSTMLMILAMEISVFEGSNLQGPLLQEWLAQNPELDLSALISSYHLKMADMSHNYAFLLKKKKEVLELLAEDKIDEALELIDKEMRKLGL